MCAYKIPLYKENGDVKIHGMNIFFWYDVRMYAHVRANNSQKSSKIASKSTPKTPQIAPKLIPNRLQKNVVKKKAPKMTSRSPPKRFLVISGGFWRSIFTKNPLKVDVKKRHTENHKKKTIFESFCSPKSIPKLFQNLSKKKDQ